jgi:LAO/AO transport system kinase
MGKTKHIPKIEQYNLESLTKGILASDIPALARSITLVESNLKNHINLAQTLLHKILPFTGNSVRIGITGAPGVGKSTFIESFGTYLCEIGKKVAILAVDPTSSISKGSVLGDKTRMERLSRYPNAFIRPSASGGALGGVARKTREAILLCEAAGFDIIIVETVGVGQSEIVVRSMVDFFLLLISPGGGDELQGFKKGSVELADAIAVNKADGENINLANITKNEYLQALHYLLPATEGWKTPVVTVSALTNVGIVDIWNIIQDFLDNVKTSGVFERRRKEQSLNWMHTLLRDYLLTSFYNHSKVKSILQEMERGVIEGKITPTTAVKEIIDTMKNENIISLE